MTAGFMGPTPMIRQMAHMVKSIVNCLPDNINVYYTRIGSGPTFHGKDHQVRPLEGRGSGGRRPLGTFLLGDLHADTDKSTM